MGHGKDARRAPPLHLELAEQAKNHPETAAQSYSVLASVLESPEQIVIFSLDRDYRYTAFNTNHRRTMKRIWGEDIHLGQRMLDVIRDEADRERAKANFDRALAGERFTKVEEYGEPPNRFVYEDLYNPILGPEGEVIGLTVFLTDITEKREAQQQLRRYHDQLEVLVEERTAELRAAYERLAEETRERRRTQQLLERAQRLEALGTLAGGVAHDFNNLLTVVVGYSEVLARRLAKDAPERGHLDKLRAACRHGADLTSRLLAFSRRQVLSPTFLEPDAVVRDTLEFLDHVLPDSVVVTTELPANLPTVRADRSQLEQVLVNLALNARDAMRGAGQLRVTVSYVPAAELDAGRAEALPHGAVRLAVEDDGCGMEPALLERIFDPFFTTKEPGKGSGLGLSMVYGIVEQHGGWLQVRSKVGEGSTFEIFLPAQEHEANERPPARLEDTPELGRGRRVLVVDDEPAIRDMVAELLGGRGFEVLLAGSATEAIEVFEGVGGAVDALFSDVVLPDLDGVQLAQQLLARRPDLPVVLASGYSETGVDPERLLHLPKYRYLGKPYEPRALLWALAELLDGTSPALEAPGEG